MEEQVENWVKAGKWEHNLPDGTHVILGGEYTTPLTAEQLEQLEAAGCPHVRKAVKAPKTEKPSES